MFSRVDWSDSSGMSIAPEFDCETSLRVLLAGRRGAASHAMVRWVAEQTGAKLAGPAQTTADTLKVAASFLPHVVLLDFHGLSIPAAKTTALLKRISPSPRVIVLTHEANEIMRRHCYNAGADAIFDKTRELEAVVALLNAIARSRLMPNS